MNPTIDVIHVGYPKTGTTWIQNEFIPRVKDFASIGKPYSRGIEFLELLNQFVGMSDFDFSGEEFRQIFVNMLSKNEVPGDERKIKIISFELLSGNMYSGYQANQLGQRIKQTFGNTRIIITIRDQAAIIESLYRHYTRAGGALHIRDFLYRRISPGVDVFGNKLVFRKFEYDKYISFMQKVFGKDNVKVLPMEMIKNAPENFAQEFLKFSKVDDNFDMKLNTSQQNRSPSYFGLIIFRIINQLLSTPYSDSFLLRPFADMHSSFRKNIFDPLDRLVFRHFFPKRKFIDYRKYFPWERFAMLLFPKFRNEDRNWTIREEIENYYKESNRWSEEFTGLELGKLGYPI